MTIIPRISLSTAERLLPYESYTSLMTKAAKEMAEERGEITEAFMDGARWGRAIQEGQIAELFSSLFEDMSKRQLEIMKKYDDEFKLQQASQINLAESIARSISPTSALTFAVQNLSGTGYERQKDYVRQLREFQTGYRNFIFDKIKNTEVKSPQEIYTKLFMQERLDISLQDVTFHYTEEPFDIVVNRILLDVGVLAIMTILFFVASYVVFMRYDVR